MMRRGNFLIAGVPGAGKTTVGEALATKGYPTIDTDSYPGLVAWVDRSSGETVVPPISGMTDDWLNSHDYLWDVEMIHQIFSKYPEGVIFYGSSSNQEKLLHLFGAVFLLVIGPDTVIDRLKNRVGNNEYGKTEDERNHVLSWYRDFQESYKAQGAIIIDADKPLNEVVAIIEDELKI